MSILRTKGLIKDFGGLRAVDRCNFEVEQGSITALIGPNGAGKTTVFNLITGLLRPDKGSVLFNGRELTHLLPHQITRSGLSRTFQITRELGEMTVLENLVIQSPTNGLLDLFRGSLLQHEQVRAMELLEFVGIADLAAEQAKNLSFGQRKLMEFASMLMSDPKMIMLDEPAGGVNPVLLDRIIDRIQQLNQDGVTFLIVEHNMDVVMNLSDSVVVMAYGKVLTQDTPEVVQRDQTVLDAYLGEA